MKIDQETIYIKLWQHNNPDRFTPVEFETLVNKYFNGYLFPHIAYGLKNTASASDFISYINKFNNKRGKK